MAFAADMLSPTINPAAIRAAGFVAVLRYLRNLSVPEITGYLDAGLGVGTIFETSADRSLGGRAAGASDGVIAASQASQLGQPAGTLLVVNLSDFAPPPSDIPAIAAYWVAFVAGATQYQCCGYATGFVIDALVNQGMKGPWWQNAMDDSGWSGDKLHPQSSMYQDTLATLPLIAGTRPSDYDQDAIIAPLNWWTLTQPGPPPHVTNRGTVLYRKASSGAVVCIDGSFRFVVLDPADYAAFTNAGIPTINVSDEQFAAVMASSPA